MHGCPSRNDISTSAASLVPLRGRDDVRRDPERRVFEMAPLQHHFELVGWTETTITIRFRIISGVCVGVGLGIFYASWMSP